MASERQVAANRQNARRSTGPKTLEGKRVIGGNAVKHGLLSRHVLLPGDDVSAFAELREGVLDTLEPAGELESLLADRIVQGLWRLRRLGVVETGLFLASRCDFEAETARAEADRHTRNRVAEMLSSVNQGDVTVTDKVAHAAALARAQQAEARKGGDVPRLGRAFLVNEGTFAALSRYETAIERGVYKALHELQRLQAARSGQVVLPPTAADVDIALSVGERLSESSAKQSQ
jgi:hypothetical protein